MNEGQLSLNWQNPYADAVMQENTSMFIDDFIADLNIKTLLAEDKGLGAKGAFMVVLYKG